MIIYRLSGRQIKELGARGQTLRIAIPEPPDAGDRPPLDLARAALPDVAQYVIDAEPWEVWVEPPQGPGLAGVIGSIQREPSGLSWLVAVIVVTLRAPTATEAAREPKIQWPASAHDEQGRRWPRGES